MGLEEKVDLAEKSYHLSTNMENSPAPARETDQISLIKKILKKRKMNSPCLRLSLEKVGSTITLSYCRWKGA